MRPGARPETAAEFLKRVKQKRFAETIPRKHQRAWEAAVISDLDPAVDPIDPMARAFRRQARDLFMRDIGEERATCPEGRHSI